MPKITKKTDTQMGEYSRIFSERLTAIIKKLGWSQTEFGKRMKTSQVQAGKYLAGKTNLTFETLDQLEKATGVPVADFFRKDNPPELRLRTLSEEVRETIFEATQQGSHKLFEEFVAKVFPVVAKMQQELNTKNLVIKEEPTEKLETFVNKLFDDFSVSPELCFLLDQDSEDDVLRIQFMRDLMRGYLEAQGKTADGMRALISEFSAKQKGKR
jgi:transcriptional regulator with XRE-family HTH domain